MKLITAIIELIVRIVNFILQKKETTAEDLAEAKKRQDELDRIKEDNDLKIAIQTGDFETIQRIREKRKKYSHLKG
jgi:hypothetical protein